MWTDQTRPRYNRDKLRYPSDVTDEEWEVLRPLIPPAKPGGRPRKVSERQIINGLLYILSTGYTQHRLPVAANTEGSAAAQHVIPVFPAL